MSSTRLRRVLLARAREMRKSPTEGERILWNRLRAKQLAGLKFRRQHVLPPYIGDFYCARAKLVVEVDGVSHQDGDSDASRDAELSRRHECEVMRVREAEVVEETQRVLEEIEAVAFRRIAELSG